MNKTEIETMINQEEFADVPWTYFDQELTRYLGVAQITGRQMEFARQCIRAVVLKAVKYGAASAKRANVENTGEKPDV